MDNGQLYRNNDIRRACNSEQNLSASLAHSLKEERSNHQINLQRLIHLRSQFITLEEDSVQLKGDMQLLDSDYKKTQKDYSGISSKYHLVANLLNAKQPLSAGLSNFKSILANDYLEFASEIVAKKEADCYLQLSAIAEELELMMGFPDIHLKTVVAISGGFSSGKSAFVNSLMTSKDIQLIEGINPMTAIPSYVVCDTKAHIKGYANNGGSIKLSRDSYESMTHDFIKSFGFDLKSIMPYMSISIPMIEGLEQVCIVDTPGYNPADTMGYTKNDKDVALKFATQSDALIWVIGLDANGTISISDLEFINDADFDKPVYFILNKADLRTMQDIEEILDDIEETLEFEEIEYKGISAYSSTQGVEKCYRKISLSDYFAECQNKEPIVDKIHRQLDKVFNHYVSSLEKNLEEYNDMKSTLKSIELDILQSADDEMYLKVKEKLVKLYDHEKSEEIVKNIKRAKNLEKKFKTVVSETVDEVRKRSLEIYG